MDTSVLIIYTGGTIGMVSASKSSKLLPFNFEEISSHLPDLKKINCCIKTIVLHPPIDSSEVSIKKWQEIVRVIEENYHLFDGFVILHGTDTMVYTASALSFMLDNLTKPVILTGSQLPIDILRTDGKKNVITAIEIAAKKLHGRAIVPEVSILFGSYLFRGNRTTKSSSDEFKAFQSYNYPPLADIGVDIKYYPENILQPATDQPVNIHHNLDNNVAILKIFPGISRQTLKSFLEIENLKGVILETFGVGNAPTFPWFTELIAEAVENNIVVANVTQCQFGEVNMHKYLTGRKLYDAGVISGKDITTEAAVTKLMYLLSKYEDIHRVKSLFQKPLKGEIS